MNPAQRFDFDYLSIHKAERQETADCYWGQSPPSSPETSFTQGLISRGEGWRHNWGSETGGLTGSAQDLNTTYH